MRRVAGLEHGGERMRRRRCLLSANGLRGGGGAAAGMITGCGSDPPQPPAHPWHLAYFPRIKAYLVDKQGVSSQAHQKPQDIQSG